MKATPADSLSFCVVHLQCALDCMDKLTEIPELFKQDYKSLVKRMIAETEVKLKIIYDVMSDEDKTAWFETMRSISQIYDVIDGLDTVEQAVKMKEFLGGV